MNDLTFGMGGPIIDGTWYNPNTGDSFTVMDSFFEDNNLLVKTTDGRIIRYDQMQHFIKSDKPIEVQKPINTYTQPVVENVVESTPIQTQSLGNLHKSNEPNDYFIINKALSKYPAPTISVNVDWGADFPKSQIQSLMDMMDIKLDDIISWYINNITSDQIAQDIANGIENSINSQLGVVQKAEEPVEEEPVEEDVKKTKTKKKK